MKKPSKSATKAAAKPDFPPGVCISNSGYAIVSDQSGNLWHVSAFDGTVAPIKVGP